MEMAELLPDHLSSPYYTDEEQSKGTRVKYKEVLNIIEWLKCFSIYIDVIAPTKFNDTVDLVGLIAQSHLKYQDDCWVFYDCQFSVLSKNACHFSFGMVNHRYNPFLCNLAFCGQGILIPNNGNQPDIGKPPICLE